MRCQHQEGAYHDCSYVDARNTLIPLAEAIARVSSDDDEAVDPAVFHATMDWLWQSMGNGRKIYEMRARFAREVGAKLLNNAAAPVRLVQGPPTRERSQ